MWLGEAEIHVGSSDGTVFEAPNLIYHYILVHKYCPPDDFIEAVMATTSGETKDKPME